MRLTAIYGANGCGRSIMPVAREMPALSVDRLVFVDDAVTVNTQINVMPVMTFNDFLADPSPDKQIVIAIASPQIRSKVAALVARCGIPLASVWASNSLVMDDVEIGEGALVSPFVTFTSNIKIGRCFHANLYSYVEHDCNIGHFVTFAPGAKCNGNVTIGDFVYIGAGAVIRQGLTIGAGATVGMGAIVTKDVPSGVTVVGNPAGILEK